MDRENIIATAIALAERSLRSKGNDDDAVVGINDLLAQYDWLLEELHKKALGHN